VYIDRSGRLTDEPTVVLGKGEYAGQVEIQAKWGEGFPQAEAISGKLTGMSGGEINYECGIHGAAMAGKITIT
jgi:hypothetical protein